MRLFWRRVSRAEFLHGIPMNPLKVDQQKKKPLPPPGRKATAREALARTNQKFHKALAKLAK